MGLIVAHVAISIISTILSWYRTKSTEAALTIFACVFFLPFAGLIIVLYYWLLKVQRKESAFDMAGLKLDTDTRYSFFNDLSIEDEVNVLPLNDVLMVSEKNTKRELFLAAIKKDINRYASYVKLALNNEDSETSHYAAAIIQKTKQKMDSEIINVMQGISNNPEDEAILCDYADLLISYLSLDLFEPIEKKKYIDEYVKTAEKIIAFNHDEKYIESLIDLLLEDGNLDKAKQYGAYYLENYDASAAMYLANMKVFYRMKDSEGLNNMLKKLKESNLMYDGQDLSMVEFWTGELNAE